MIPVVVDSIARLAARELQVMDPFAVAGSSKEIVATSTISVRTVEGHRRLGAPEDAPPLAASSRPQSSV